MTSTELPLAALVAERCRELGLRRSEVAARCGYKNISKGIRRLEQVLAGDFESAAALLRGLPNALNLSPDVVQDAIDQTVRSDRSRAGCRLACQFSAECVRLGNDRPAFANIVFRNYGRPGEVAEDSTRPDPTS